jgi:hypothetical protein
MNPLVIATAGPMVAAIFGLAAFTGRRIILKTDAQLEKMAVSMEHISETVTSIQVDLPQKFVSREDFFRHIKDEERWQDELRSQMYNVQDQLSSIRSQPHQHRF